MPMDDVRAVLGVGGNVGDVPSTLSAALSVLDASPHIGVEDVSALYRTPPWGKTDQEHFFNACALVRTGLAARELLDFCLAVERQFKRDRLRDERWGPRTLDIDILLHGETVCDTPTLQLPHPRIAERAFVLVPLADILPEIIIGGKSVGSLARASDRTGIVQVKDRGWWSG